jgi:hypothetical protein
VVEAARMSLEAAAAEVFPESVSRLRAALGPDRPGAAALWPALSRLDWAMALPNAAAPGFVYLAGACGGAAVGGGGRDLAEAAGRLGGEASEALAQAGPPAADCALPAHPALRALWGDGPRVVAANLTQGTAAGAPAAAIHSAAAAPPGAPPRSLGLAAGPDQTAARLAAVLELVERDAAASWWAGDARPRAVDAALLAAAGAALAALRAGAPGPWRPTTFLALPSPTGLPVACALSRDAAGRGLAIGLKAALDLPAALAGATMELLQMEIALEIARLRAAQGRDTPADAVPLGTAALDPDGFAAFAAAPPAPAHGPEVAGFDDLVAHLAGLGLEVLVVDLAGPPGGLSVAKAFVPGLRPMPGPGPDPRPDAPGAWARLM